ncbi:hypothetical protein D3C73_1086680 [compost metagenome]
MRDLAQPFFHLLDHSGKLFRFSNLDYNRVHTSKTSDSPADVHIRHDGPSAIGLQLNQNTINPPAGANGQSERSQKQIVHICMVGLMNPFQEFMGLPLAPLEDNPSAIFQSGILAFMIFR